MWQGQKVFLGGYGFGGGSPLLAGRWATGVLGEGPSTRAFVVGDGKTRDRGRRHRGPGLVRRAPQRQARPHRHPQGHRRGTGGALPAERVDRPERCTRTAARTRWASGAACPSRSRSTCADQTEAAILEAWFNRAPGELYYGTGRGQGPAHEPVRNDPANQSQDSDVRVLQARDARRRAVRDDAELLGALDGAGVRQHAHQRRLGPGANRDDGPALRRQVDDDDRDVRPHAARPRGGLPAAREHAGAGAVQDRRLRRAGRRPRAAGAGRRDADHRQGARRGELVPRRGPVDEAPILGFATVGPEGGSITGLPFNRASTPPWQTANVSARSRARRASATSCCRASRARSTPRSRSRSATR